MSETNWQFSTIRSAIEGGKKIKAKDSNGIKSDVTEAVRVLLTTYDDVIETGGPRHPAPISMDKELVRKVKTGGDRGEVTLVIRCDRVSVPAVDLPSGMIEALGHELIQAAHAARVMDELFGKSLKTSGEVKVTESKGCYRCLKEFGQNTQRVVEEDGRVRHVKGSPSCE